MAYEPFSDYLGLSGLISKFVDSKEPSAGYLDLNQPFYQMHESRYNIYKNHQHSSNSSPSVSSDEDSGCAVTTGLQPFDLNTIMAMNKSSSQEVQSHEHKRKLVSL